MILPFSNKKFLDGIMYGERDNNGHNKAAVARCNTRLNPFHFKPRHACRYLEPRTKLPVSGTWKEGYQIFLDISTVFLKSRY